MLHPMDSILSGMKPHRKELHLRIFAIPRPKTLSILYGVISVYESLFALIFQGSGFPPRPNGRRESKDSLKQSYNILRWIFSSS